LKPVGNGKLSKRDGDKLISCISTEWKTEEGISSGYRKGFFPEAVVNFWPYWVGMTDGQRVVYFGRISGSF
jgi:glutamyl-tRNA synthetase